MVSKLSGRHKWIACILLSIFYCDFVFAAYRPFVLNRGAEYAQWQNHPATQNMFGPSVGAKEVENHTTAFSTPFNMEPIKHPLHVTFNKQSNKFNKGNIGPTQPEMQAFQSVNVNNMVDLFSGDFSYNIPLIDVGGYPINLSYKSGISMDQEASWVGLGWNVNPGTITRNVRGLPDDFNGKNDSVIKINHIKENKTIGVSLGLGAEEFGLPLGVSASSGIFYNNYKGYGLENSMNVTLNAATSAKGSLTAGLSLNNNSQDGLSITPSLSYKYDQSNADQAGGAIGSLSTSLTYNSRVGLKSLQLSAGYRQYAIDDNNQKQSYGPGLPGGSISFALPAYNPKMTTSYTSQLYSFTGKVGGELFGFHPNAFVSGYVSTQGINNSDTILALPAYGYLNYQNSVKDPSALLDFNTEKELPYREKPGVPNIGIPNYTYDLFSMTGEGTSGMFRAYRGDIGFVYDHYIKSKDASDGGSFDWGFGNIVHAGVDININHSYTTTGPWLYQNPLKDSINFRPSDTTYEGVYFRNPEEKSVNSTAFYNAIGGDQVVSPQLLQNDNNDPNLQTSALLNKYTNKRLSGTLALTHSNDVKTVRDKRTQVISYLNAQEADLVGVSKYIENISYNQFSINECSRKIPDLRGLNTGLKAEYYTGEDLTGTPVVRNDALLNGANWKDHSKMSTTVLYLPDGVADTRFSARWTSNLQAPVTGTYTINVISDDGINVWLNDSAVITNWTIHAPTKNSCTVNLVAGEYYSLKVEYYQHDGLAQTQLTWSYPSQTEIVIPSNYFYYPSALDTFKVDNKISVEKRVNSFRKPNHISEIDALNPDGKRYIYGIPVYNFIQKDVTFAVNNGSSTNGTSSYTPGIDNSTKNSNGQDNYYNCEITPAYAHSFLLTAILSPDYVDVTGDGITDDDLGDAIKFDYTKVAGINNPYKWRTPYPSQSNIASYNEGLKTDSRDDKANYTYGEKELWYLNSIQSKNMIAVFLLEDRDDLFPVDESGKKIGQHLSKRLKEIRLYSKADFVTNGLNAIPIKTVHFEYSYDLCPGFNSQISSTTGKLTLKKVWFSYNGNNKSQQNPYIFNYSTLNPSYDSKSYDRWGNYKPSSQNPGSLMNAEYPYSIQPNYQTYTTDSSAIANNTSAWALDSIMLPTGGRIKVTYESDDYAYVQNKRAMQMFSVAGLGYQPDNTYTSNLYTSNGLVTQENLIVYATVNKPVSNASDVFNQYLQGIDTIYFKLFVKVPNDKWGGGSEFISCYASVDRQGIYYGRKDNYTIWFKIKGVNKKGDGDGAYSPLTKAAIQYLRLNLPSKAYPGSELGDNFSVSNAVQMIGALSDNIMSTITGFDDGARSKGWVSLITPAKSFVRLDNPDYKKFGGGLRVKRIKLYDNWKNQTDRVQKESVYGQEYSYTTTQQINGKTTVISSGVASYEPMIGNEENPWHVPIQYTEKAAILAPVTLGYTEEPLCEAFFPAASVGYSNVRVRSINTANRKSANGYEETSFYTTYDFPTITDRSVIDNDTKKKI